MVVAALAFILGGCSVGIPAKDVENLAGKLKAPIPNMQCWRHQMAPPLSNAFTLCKNAEWAKYEVFFFNGGSNSTVCRHLDRVTRRPDSILRMDFTMGACDNGRTLGARLVACADQADGSLECLSVSGSMQANYRFVPISNSQADRYP